MASSNRHWPSMFKSKPCNNHHPHQWQQHDQNPNSLLSSGCHKPPYSSGPVSEERSPEPKPRWNPKPEQIRILEKNSILEWLILPETKSARLGFTSKNSARLATPMFSTGSKTESLEASTSFAIKKNPTTTTSAPPPSTTSSSSSSSDKSSPKGFPMEMTNSLTASVNNNPTYFQAPVATEFLGEPYLYPMGGFSFMPEVSCAIQTPPVDGSMLLGELLMMNNNNHNHNVTTKKFDHDHEKVYNTTIDATAVSSDTSASINATTVSSTISHFLGIGVGDSHPLGLEKSTVFINDVAFEVNFGPFNVREFFGDDAMLIQSNGQPVFTNEWGVTLQSLQHGGFYYLVRTLAPVVVSEAQPN